MDRRQPGRLQISIHALREEGDSHGFFRPLCIQKFLSTPSARRATRHVKGGAGGILLFLSTPSARRATWE